MRALIKADEHVSAAMTEIVAVTAEAGFLGGGNLSASLVAVATDRTGCTAVHGFLDCLNILSRRRLLLNVGHAVIGAAKEIRRDGAALVAIDARCINIVFAGNVLRHAVSKGGHIGG